MTLQIKNQDHFYLAQSVESDVNIDQDDSFQLELTQQYNNKSDQQQSLFQNYQQNYVLLVHLLSIQKKSNIVKYKSLHLSNENIITISMQKGHHYNLQNEWFGPIPKDHIPIEQKYKFMVDVCKGLMNLTELKILHLDIRPQNIIKVKDKFKIIDFDCALFVKITDTYPKYRNYLRGSEVQVIKKELYANCKEILRKQLQFYQKKQLQTKNILWMLFQIPFLSKIISSLHIGIDKIVEQLMNYLPYSIEFIHSVQLAKLIEQIFNQEQIQQMEKIIPIKGQRKEFKNLIQLLELPTMYNLSIFYSQLTKTQICEQDLKVVNLSIADSQLIQNIHNKRREQFWKDILTFKPCNSIQQQFDNFQNKNHYSQWYSQSLQHQIQKEVKQIIKQISQEDNNTDLLDMVEIQLFDGNSQFFLNLNEISSITQMDSNTFQSSFLPLNKINFLNNNLLNGKKIALFGELKTRKNEIVTQSMEENCCIFKLLLAKYIKTKIVSNYLYYPISFKLNQPKTRLRFYYQRQQDAFQDIEDIQDRIKSVWEKGFKNVINFIRQITKAVLDLQKFGLFHPEINMENIISLNQKQNGKNHYKVKNLQKCHFLSFHYMLEKEQQTLLNANKMVFYHLLNPHLQQQKQSLISQSSFSNNLIDYLSEISDIQGQSKQKSLIFSKDLIEANKTTLIFQLFRQSFNKMHSRQLGHIFKDLFEYYQHNRHYKHSQIKSRKAFFPVYWNQKYDRAREITKQLFHGNIKDRITVQSFYSQFNELFPTCQVTNHQGQMILYYHKQQQNKELLCNQCIKDYKRAGIQLFCIDHGKPIRYLQPNTKNIDYLGKLYYCEQCCESLLPNTDVRLIDSTDLCECKYICMDLSCQNSLISEQNKIKNHSSHNCITFKEFDHFYQAANTENSYETIQSCRQKGNALVSQLHKITANYTKQILDIFKVITTFKVEGSSQCQRLYKILHPNDPYARMNRNDYQSEETIFWKVLKTMHFIHEKSKEKQFQMISVQGFVEYCNFKFTELASKANKQISKILSKVYSNFQAQIFSKNIHNQISQYVRQKYGQIINNEKACQIKPVYFDKIPERYSSAVVKLSIQKQQTNLKEYFQVRNQERINFQKFCKERCQIYTKWIDLINNQNQNFNLIGDIKKDKKRNGSVKHSFIQEHQLWKTLVLNSINCQKIQIQKKKNQHSQSDCQKLNLLALQRKRQVLDNQRQSIEEIMKELQKIDKLNKQIKDINNQQFKKNKFAQIESNRNKIIEQLDENSKILTLQHRAFNIQFMYNLKCFSQDEIDKICMLPNLRQINFVQNQNPIFMKTLDREYSLTAEMLQSIVQNCTKLNKIHIRGGFVEMIPCLSYLVKSKDTSEFLFYVNTTTVISERHQIQLLRRYLFSIKFSFPCVNIRIRNDIDAEEMQMIIDIISKVKQLKLEVCGPLQRNGFALQILKHIAKQYDLKVTSLSLRRFKMSKQKNVLAEIAQKGKIQSIILVNCIDYNGQFLKYCQRHLKTAIIKGSLGMQVPTEFMSSLLNCSTLEVIDLNNINFSVSSLSLGILYNLNCLALQYCPSVTDKFVKSLNKATMQSIQYFILKECTRIEGDCIEAIAKMPQLKCLVLSHNKIPIEKLLSLQTSQLQILHFRQCKIINDQFLHRIGQKWPRIIDLAVPRFSQITARAIKRSFKNLKNIIIFREQLTTLQKHFLVDKMINIEEYN